MFCTCAALAALSLIPGGPRFPPGPRAPPALLCEAEAPAASEVLGRTSPAVLAYLGDAIFETSVREKLMWPPQKLDVQTRRARRLVCAEGQEALLARLVADFPLSALETDWLRRGRNASGRGPSRVSAKTYRAATSFECLLGYLHLSDPARLDEVLDFVLGTAVPELEQQLGEGS
eukprot:4140965-Prymnesium_polylepis.1